MAKLLAIADAACPGAPLPLAAGQPANRTSCSGLAGLRAHLLVGVHSAPVHAERRQAVRVSWMQWESVGRSVAVCFLIGRRGLTKVRTHSLEAEAALHRDIILLDVVDRAAAWSKWPTLLD